MKFWLRGSFKLITIRGIQVRIHFTWLFLPFIFGLVGLQKGPLSGLMAIVLICFIFICVILHEMSHSLVAQSFGVRVRDITLLPIGGVATITNLPEKPSQELAIALAGPPVNFLLSLLLSIPLVGSPSIHRFWRLILEILQGKVSFPPSDWYVTLVLIIYINIILGLFNLLPAFPMDGGRVLRAYLAQRMDYLRATKVAASLGHGFAFLFAVVGIIFVHPILFLIAIFIYFGASQEELLVGMKQALRGLRVEDLLPMDFKVLSPEDNLEKGLALMMHSHQEDFPVVKDGRLVGLLTKDDILSTIKGSGVRSLVAEVMKTHFETIRWDDSLTEVHRRMMKDEISALPVVEEGLVLGMVTMEDIKRIYTIMVAKGS